MIPGPTVQILNEVTAGMCIIWEHSAYGFGWVIISPKTCLTQLRTEIYEG